MSDPNKIPFNKPFIVGKELYYVSQAVLSGHLAGNGGFTKRCQAWLEQHTGVTRALLTHSCTAALEMAALIYDIGPGDEVIMPSYTFVSTANAFVLRGAKPRFVDVRADTLNLDETKIEAAINERTKAIVPVHYGGVGCEMHEIMRIADRHGLKVIEDAAQALDATYHGAPLGGFGHLSCLSFHETKNFISGEGGSLLIQDPEALERAEIIWEKGTNRQQFFRGQVDKYTWVDVGSSYLPSELIAAFLFAQLEHASEITARFLAIGDRYRQAFQSLESDGLVGLPKAPPHCRHNGHMFYLLVSSVAERDALIAHLKAKAIHAVFHYVPLHNSPMGQRLGCADEPLPVTEDRSARLVHLPCYFELSERDQDRVIAEVRSFYTGRGV
ncbi:MAG: dTDP-4-amino-4,6-dideoxygalactose transaminase [Planctomycetota bacterium]|jgi:dTDP-4-amino-4,6-dideoxygalactose transaminase